MYQSEVRSQTMNMFQTKIIDPPLDQRELSRLRMIANEYITTLDEKLSQCERSLGSRPGSCEVMDELDLVVLQIIRTLTMLDKNGFFPRSSIHKTLNTALRSCKTVYDNYAVFIEDVLQKKYRYIGIGILKGMLERSLVKVQEIIRTKREI